MPVNLFACALCLRLCLCLYLCSLLVDVNVKCLCLCLCDCDCEYTRAHAWDGMGLAVDGMAWQWACQLIMRDAALSKDTLSAECCWMQVWAERGQHTIPSLEARVSHFERSQNSRQRLTALHGAAGYREWISQHATVCALHRCLLGESTVAAVSTIHAYSE